VVLMDVQMPEMDGITATTEICKRWEQLKRPWIIAMTANAIEGDREACLQAGMNDYVSKPIQIQELIHSLSQTPTSNSSGKTQHSDPSAPLETVQIK
jgi:CheY-like chemotaxis protein